MNIIVFDTETNGFPPSCRIIQMAWACYSFSGELLSSEVYLIRPDGWEIPVKKFWLDNGYSTEKNAQLGVPMRQVLLSLCGSLVNSQVAVAHNMDFDYPIIKSEMEKYGVTAGVNLRKVCTMKAWANHCGGKWPKLFELHEELFGEGFADAHDAMVDVFACARVFFEMKKREIIKL